MPNNSLKLGDALEFSIAFESPAILACCVGTLLFYIMRIRITLLKSFALSLDPV